VCGLLTYGVPPIDDSSNLKGTSYAASAPHIGWELSAGRMGEGRVLGEVKARVAHGETLDDDASRLQLIEHVQSGGPRKPAKSRYMMWFSQRRDHRRKSSVGAVSSAASEQHKQGKLLSRMSTSSLLGGRKQSEAVLS